MIIGARAHNVEQAAALAERKVPFVEISVLSDTSFQQDLKQLRRLQETHGTAFLAHGPEEGDAWNPEGLRHELLPRINRISDCLPELGIEVFTIHFWLDSRFIAGRILEKKIRILRDMAEYAAGRGVQLCLENLSEQAADFDAALSSIATLGMTLDIGHGELLSETNTAYDFLANHFEKIYHMHVHDNQGGESPIDDLHMVPGQGVVDFKSILKAAGRQGYDRTITVEVGPEDAVQARRYIQQVWDALQYPERIQS